MGSKEMEKALASGDDKKIEAALQAQFVAAWGAAAGKARSNKAKVAAKKDGAKVGGEAVLIGCVLACAIHRRMCMSACLLLVFLSST
jgi:hypothetical protein